MDRPRPSVITALFWAYWDLGHVLQKAWRPALFAFLVLSFGSFAALVGPRMLTYDPAGQAVMRLAILVGLCFLLTPFFLAVHRFLLLGEAATRYDFKPSTRVFSCSSAGLPWVLFYSVFHRLWLLSRNRRGLFITSVDLPPILILRS